MRIRSPNRHENRQSTGGPGHLDGGESVARWVSRRPAAHGHALEDRAGELLRRGASTPVLSEPARLRVQARLAATLANGQGPARRRPLSRPPQSRSTASSERRWRARSPIWHWGLAIGVVFGSGVVIAARGVGRWWNAEKSPRISGASSGPLATARPEHGGRRPGKSGVDIAATITSSREAVVPAPSNPAPAALMLAPTAGAIPAPSSLASAVGSGSRSGVSAILESRLAVETRLLYGALIRLRQGRDAAGALSDLDEYSRRFPHGILAGEARVARIDALLLLERHGEALATLDTLSLGNTGRDQELRIIRGELRARLDCGGAIFDFNRILSGGAPRELMERALYGRAVCWSRRGRDDEARRDADRYLSSFPNGRFTVEARVLGGAAVASGARSAP